MELNFYMPVQVKMGADCVRRYGRELKKLGSRALIVTGTHSSGANGSLDDVKAALTANGQTWVLFDRVMENPTVDCIYEGAVLARKEKADFVIGIGGGSPMDASKAIAWLAVTEVPREKVFDTRPSARLPLCCIPTTAGTGSEVTKNSIITNDTMKTKSSLSDPALFADLALLDGKYMAAMPHRIMVNTVIDSLSHSMESFLSGKASPLTEVLALQAMKEIAGLLPRLTADELTAEDHELLLHASTLGGIVIAQTGTSAVHAMGYPLTYFRHIPHGRANGLLLTGYLEMLEKAGFGERNSRMLTAMNMDSLEEFSKALDALLGEKEKFTEEELESFTASAGRAKNLTNCVLPFDRDMVEALYRRSFGM